MTASSQLPKFVFVYRVQGTLTPILFILLNTPLSLRRFLILPPLEKGVRGIFIVNPRFHLLYPNYQADFWEPLIILL